VWDKVNFVENRLFYQAVPTKIRLRQSLR
jgi:hypothetical protein